MGRASGLNRLLAFVRGLLEGKREDDLSRPLWHLDSLEKCLSMWPEIPGAKNAAVTALTGDAVFSHLRRLYRFGFRLNVKGTDLRLRQFFADGEMYRPEGYARGSSALIADLAHLADGKNALRVGQCRVAKAGPVLRALGFPDLLTGESFAVQFGGLGDERWIFIDARPEVFRREASAAIAKKLAEIDAAIGAKIAYDLNPATEKKPRPRNGRYDDEGPAL